MKSSITISPGWIGSIRSASVVVDEFDIICTSISPDEADTPLRVHTDAVLSASVADETLQLIPGRGLSRTLDVEAELHHVPQRNNLLPGAPLAGSMKE
jgi:hypothetical protein